ncbi:25S rRNA (cytosine-C(5))-methyltransferase nop2 [Ceratocystis fimbriata CBS 114723]|uniref:Nucleolar protein 2 n=1 Tax=Ceratocystis fimbriata CBS 114723 TaxID=1035309 RepID=A0A2C5X9I2_9PEZI|nr:25S rRNA (cytosine-C(5))-methyltransferase nop2 [Ceratocystis fimbriata CBS 114723]
MGVGRRMGKKQGIPEALSEEHFAKLKRKAGLPVDDVSDEPEKKRRRGAKRAAVEKAKQDKEEERVSRTAKKALEAKSKKAAAAALTAAAFPTPKKASIPAKAKKAKKTKVSLAPSSDEEEEEEDEDMADEFPDAEVDDSDDGEEPLKLRDDFLGSDLDDDDDEDNDVYDSDEDHTHGGKMVFSEDEDESEGEERLTRANIAAMSRKIDEERALEEEAAEAEMRDMQTNIDGDDRPKILDSADNDEDDLDGEDPLYAKPKALLAPDLQLLRTRITETIRVLDSFSQLAEPGRSRSEYTAQLIKDMCAYYGYSQFLCEKLFALFPPREAFAFFEANESGRPVVIRTNTLRTHRRDLAQALINRGVTLEPVGKWSKVGLQIFESNVPLGATPEYLAGHYILQAASSFLPCVALDPQENERVLDMAAAPGGKTTYLAAMMKNTGFVLANDPNKSRAKALIGNVHRLGCRNVVVCNHDARDFPKPIGGFDRVLLDAPCSGTGVISKDPSVKTNKTERDFQTLPHTQKQLLLAAIDSVNHASKTGGYIVYSTCSVTVEENEQVVQYALSRRPNVRLVDSGLTFGKEGFTSIGGKTFDPSLKLTRRYYPHTYNVDGFYVAKFQKFAATPAKAVRSDASSSAAPTSDDDHAPVIDEDGLGAQMDKENEEVAANDFGGFDEEEDNKLIEKARRNSMRRRGFDPRASVTKKKDGKKTDEKTEEKTEEKTKEMKASEKTEKKKADKANKKEEDINITKPKVAQQEAKATKKSKKAKKTAK